MAFIENESEEKLVLKRGKVYYTKLPVTENQYFIWRFDKLDILPSKKSLSLNFPGLVVNRGSIKVYFSFTGMINDIC